VPDGNLSDWGGATIWQNVKFQIPKAAPTQTVAFEEYSGGVWTGPEDHSNAWAIAWDDNNLYIGMVVTDEYHQTNATGPTSAWNGDGLQLAVANDARDTITHLYNYGLGGEEGALTEVFTHDERGPGGTFVSIVRNTAAKKTIYEIRLPASSIDKTKLEAGMKIGVGLCVNDGDQDTPGQKGWSGWGVHSIVFGKTAAQTGLVTLGAGPEPSTELAYSAEPANYIAADGNLADWAGKEFRGPTAFKIPKNTSEKLVYFETLSGGGSIAADSVWTGPEDHSSLVSFAWQKDALHIGVVVTDDYHQSNATGPTSAWNGDGLQVAVANGAKDAITHLYNYALGGEEGALTEVFTHNERGPGGTKAAIVRSGKTTSYEITMPASALDMTEFKVGQKINIGLCINDGDQEKRGQAGWSGWGVHSIVHGKSADRTGTITLAAAKAPNVLTYNAPPVTAGFNIIDGDLSDWRPRPFIGPVSFEIPKATGGTPVFFETLSGAASVAASSIWTGPEDHTSVLSMAWEKDALYIGVVVTDEYHQSNATGPTSAWNGDGLQLAVANGARDTITHLYNYALGGEEGALTEVFTHDERGPGGTQVAIVRKGTTTTYELRLPASALDMTEFKEGQKLGIGICINDGDKDKRGQAGWSGWGVHSIVHGKTADKTGLVTLTAGGTVVVPPPTRPPVIEYVNVGNPGNKADAPQQGGQFGAVGYAYQIGKFKVTVAQYAAFLNARAASDPHGLFNENMEITREGGDGSYTYTVQAGKANRPIRWVEPVDCLRFCNWLHNGGQANSDTETGAYRFSTPETPGPRSVGAKVFLPTEDEWYKAAYYDPTKGGTGGYWKFAVKADDTVADLPPGGPRSANFDAVNRDDGGTTDVGAYRSASSYYGTFDQTGNVWEWLEPASAAPDMSRRRSGSWENAIGRLSSDQTGVSALGVGGTQHQGFRVGAAVGIVPPRPTLTITRSGDNLEIVWPAGARLESATAVQGPWSAVANVSSPLRLKPDAARRFYRSSQ